MSDQAPNTPQAPQALRFDQIIANEADQLVQDLVNRHPELRGAAVIFDWDLPKNASGTLPAGAWRTKDNLVTPDKCYAMQHQLARFINHMSKTILRMMEETVENYRRLQAGMETQGAGAPSTMAARPAGPPPAGLGMRPAPQQARPMPPPFPSQSPPPPPPQTRSVPLPPGSPLPPVEAPFVPVAPPPLTPVPPRATQAQTPEVKPPTPPVIQ